MLDPESVERPRTAPEAPTPGTPREEAAAVVREGLERKKEELAAASKEKGRATLEAQKARAADELEAMASVLKRAANEASEEKGRGIGPYAERAAQYLERLSRTLRAKDVGALVRDAEQLTRRHPAAVFGGALLAGVAIGRLLKAVRRRGPEAA